jgi:hypothetical protein
MVALDGSGLGSRVPSLVEVSYMKKLLLSVAALSLLSLAAAPALAAEPASPSPARSTMEPSSTKPAKSEKKQAKRHVRPAPKAAAKTPAAK